MITQKQFPHHMLREIYEQPQVAIRAVAAYLSPESKQRALEDVRLTDEAILRIGRINMVASGTSRHAGMVGEFIIERLARIPVEVDFASQYCYRDPLTEANELTVVLSQSGTTADTLAALREAKEKGAKVISICNVRGTPITLESDGNVYTHAGEEIAIAATKSFLSQLIAVFALGLHLGSVRRALTAEETRGWMRALMDLPQQVETALQCDDACRRLAEQWKQMDDFIFLGRDISYPIALEGALKVKETSYIHAEGFPTGELPHGPTALIDEHLPVIVIDTVAAGDPESERRHQKTYSLLQQIRDQGAHLFVVANADKDYPGMEVLRVPSLPALLSPIVEIVPLQLLAYHLAVLRGVDVDRPRNLTKSVTKE